jgi:dTDP-glucose 4,6-dehydratase
MGTLNVMTASRDHDVVKVIHTSTSEVYGSALQVPIDENHPLQGQSPYSASKIGADKIAESFFSSYSLPVMIIRPFNIYGPRQSARAVIPTIITQALTGKEIFLGDLSPTRDFTYVKDTVEAFAQIAECDEAIGRTFNIGSGFEISIGEIAEIISRITKSEIKIIKDEQRIRPEKSEVQRLLADSTLAQKTFGWIPKTPLKKGLGYTIDWISENLHRYKICHYIV